MGLSVPSGQEELLALHHAALAAVDPYHAVRRVLQDGLAGSGPLGEVLGRSERFSRILVVGAGKASARMAVAVEELLGQRVTDGVLVVKYGHTGSLSSIRQIEAAHPVPDESGVRGTRRILELLSGADEQTLVLCLLSGGGSALLVAPAGDLDLADKQAVTGSLLRSGANIEQLNAVRKHLSAVKGGRLAREASPATVATLVLSDVIGDRLDVIASGPTVPDPSTFADALAVLDAYGLRASLPPRVSRYLERGVGGKEPETLKEGDPSFRSVSNVVIGSNMLALQAAKERARELGYLTTIINAQLQGDARSAARDLADHAKRLQDQLSPADQLCLLAGGETTVVVRGNGRGGRNQEMALAMALEIQGRGGMAFLSAGTDGNDGPTDAAGAYVDGNTIATARSAGLDPLVYLENNDSYSFFEKYDTVTNSRSHLKTGPTGTNVMDLQYLIVQGANRR